MTEIEKKTLRLAREVMGWKIEGAVDVGYWTFDAHDTVLYIVAPGSCPLWRPYDSIADAWMLVEKLRRRFTNISIHGANGWGVTLGDIRADEDNPDGPLIEKWIGPFGDTGNPETPCEAICEAALKTLGAKQ